MSWWLLLMSCAMLAEGGGKPRGNKAWASMRDDDWKAAEHDSARGDDEWELLSEEQHEYMAFERKRTEELLRNPSSFEVPSDGPPVPPVAMDGGANPHVGPAMLFATLKSRLRSGKQRSRDEVSMLAVQWQDLLATGHLEVTPYVVEDYQVLFTLKQGWNAAELKDFLLDQSEVEFVEWENKRYTAAERKDEEERARKAALRKGKGKGRGKGKGKGRGKGKDKGQGSAGAKKGRKEDHNIND